MNKGLTQIKEIIERVNRLSEQLESLRPISPDNEQKIMQKFRLEWNYNSNNIEGNTLTYGETKALLLFGITAQGKPLKDHLEIQGHNEAINYIEDVVKQKKPLTEAFIRELHKMILHEPYQIDAITVDGKPTTKWVKIGEYKTQPNHVKTITGEIFRFALPEETPAKMEDLMNWYRENLKNRQIHPLILASEFHYRFIRIHPFDDGNGRLARILMNFIFMQNGFPPIIVKTKDKMNYYSVLQQADAGNLEPFIVYMGNLLISSFEIMIKGAKGESIEEIEDIDKEIALLKQQLESVEEIKEIQNDENTKKVGITFYEQFADIIIPGLKDIRDFYRETSFFQIINRNFKIPIVTPRPVHILGPGDVYVNHPITHISSYGFSYDLQDFKKTSGIPFSDHILFEIIFQKYKYVLNPGKFNEEIIKLYHQTLTNAELKKIIHENKKACFSFIKQQLKIVA